MEAKCPMCLGSLEGRSDKKFCSDVCRNKYHYDKNPDYYNDHKLKIISSQQKYKANNYIKSMVTEARRRAKIKDLKFDITPDDLVIPEHCPLLGIKLAINVGVGRQNNSSTLDRIIPELGYVKGNVWIISWKANRVKSDLSYVELKQFCENLLTKLESVKELPQNQEN